MFLILSGVSIEMLLPQRDGVTGLFRMKVLIIA